MAGLVVLGALLGEVASWIAVACVLLARTLSVGLKVAVAVVVPVPGGAAWVVR